MEGRRVAVLVGCNYKGTLAELRGCVNDVWGMHAALVDRFHFKPDEIQVLVDNDPQYTLPTGANIRRALQVAIASTSGPGDVLFFHFSGHGTQLPAYQASSIASPKNPLDYDECIVPCDMNLLTDEDIREVVDLLPQGVTFTIIADSCHSGGLIRYEKEQIGDSFENQGMLGKFQSGAKTIDSEDIQTIENDLKKNNNPVFGVNRSLLPSTLVEMLMKQSGDMDMNVTNVQCMLAKIFKEEVSTKFKSHGKKRDNTYLSHGKNSSIHNSDTTCITGSLGLPLRYHSPSKYLVKSYDKSQAPNYVLGSNGKGDQAILISACQAYENAKDITPCDTNKIIAFGAMSHAILDVLSKLEGNAIITNHDLVKNVRKFLLLEGISHQHPGLYCCDNHVNATFITG